MQEHEKFKVFAGKEIAGVAAEAQNYFNTAPSFHPKSVGVEFVEEEGMSVLTIGYTEADSAVPSYKISLNIVPLGTLDFSNLADLGSRLEEAAAQVQNVICHEMLVTENKQAHVIFMRAE